MKFDILKYNEMLTANNISVIYSGPIWPERLEGLAEMLQSRLDLEEMPLNASQSIFSVFIEQMNNMMMHSAEKEHFERSDNTFIEVSKGIFIFGMQEKTYFIQSGNVIENDSIEMLRNRIEYLNTLDKKELRQFFREQIKAENPNPGSKGAGLGLIEIARRASSKIEYDFIPVDGQYSYFTIYVVV